MTLLMDLSDVVDGSHVDTPNQPREGCITGNADYAEWKLHQKTRRILGDIVQIPTAAVPMGTKMLSETKFLHIGYPIT